MAKAAPHRYVATMSKAARQGKIFIDDLRNGQGATAVLSLLGSRTTGSSGRDAGRAEGFARSTRGADDRDGAEARRSSKGRPVGRPLRVEATAAGRADGLTLHQRGARAVDG